MAPLVGSMRPLLEEPPASIVIVFQIGDARTHWGEQMRVVGDCVELGRWSPEEAVSLSTGAASYPRWCSSEVQLCSSPAGGGSGVSGWDGYLTIRYKYVRDRRALDGAPVWEVGADRTVRIPAEPLVCLAWLVIDTAYGRTSEPPQLVPLAGGPPPPVAPLGAGCAPAPEETSEPEGFGGYYCLVGDSPVATGGFSSVWRCRPRGAGGGGTAGGGGAKERAVKRIDKADMPAHFMRLLFGRGSHLGEINLHKCVQHKNIVGLLEVFDDASVVSLVMEYCRGGDLFEIVRSHHTRWGRGLPERGAAAAEEQLLAALAFLHARDIVHRDVKCENICQLEAQGSVPLEKATFKLGDFGLATQLLPDQVLLERVGSPSTSAPEVVDARPYAKPADIWSAGAVLYTMLAARRPFQASTWAHMLQNSGKLRVNLQGRLWETNSAPIRSFLGLLLKPSPSQRPTAAAALEHLRLQFRCP